MASKRTKKEKLSPTFSKTLVLVLTFEHILKKQIFFDVTLNLQNSTYRPYKKPNVNLLYCHSSSNDPPQIIKELPNSISEKLPRNSSNQETFNTAKVEYEEALKKSSYNVHLKYNNSKSEKRESKT